MPCKRCGRCCHNVYVILSDVPVDAEGHDEQEKWKWFRLHGIGTKAAATIDGLRLGIEIPLNCHDINYDDDTGGWTCGLHGTPGQPKLCRDYRCEKAKRNGES